MLSLKDFKEVKIDNPLSIKGGYIDTTGGDGCVNGECIMWESDRTWTILQNGNWYTYTEFYGVTKDVGSCG